MSANVRIININSTNDFELYIKEGDSPYPIYGNEYVFYDVFSGGTTTISIDNYSFENSIEYWIKLVDIITGKYIVENINTLFCADCELVGIVLDIDCDFTATAYRIT